MNGSQSGIILSELDRERFGFSIAWAKDIRKEMLSDILSSCKNAGVELLIARCEASDWPTIHALEQTGFLLMDTIVYYERDVNATVPEIRIDGISTREASLADAHSLRNVALEAFHGYVGHYHNDPALPKDKADAVYADWAYRSVMYKSVADTVLLAIRGYEIVGFITLRKSGPGTAEVPLNAVSPHARRRGVYRLLLAEALGWCKQHGVRKCFISTQLSNSAPQRAWGQMGFLYSHAVYTFHKWFCC